VAKEQAVRDAPDQQVSLTDPDARSMATSGRGTGVVGYNVQIAVNAEHHLIDWIHEARETAAGVIINPAAFTHSSIAIMDALSACEFPILEVHISNVHRREAFRHHSYVSLTATGVMAGFGAHGYLLALRHMAYLLARAA